MKLPNGTLRIDSSNTKQMLHIKNFPERSLCFFKYQKQRVRKTSMEQSKSAEVITFYNHRNLLILDLKLLLSNLLKRESLEMKTLILQI